MIWVTLYLEVFSGRRWRLVSAQVLWNFQIIEAVHEVQYSNLFNNWVDTSLRPLHAFAYLLIAHEVEEDGRGGQGGVTAEGNLNRRGEPTQRESFPGFERV